jgi:predicted nicotinamide N-methyase
MRKAADDTLILTYPVTAQLAVHLTELCTWRPDFPRCRACGASEFWHIAWPSALALARHLATTFGAARVLRRRALVLGCGVGLESVVLATLGAQVWALDHVRAALRLVWRNCELNGLAPVHTLWRCWREPSTLRRLGSYELVIGSDILYEPAGEEAIAGLLQTALTPQGVGLFADPGREGVAEFFRRLAAGGVGVPERRTQLRWLGSRQEIWIYQVTRARLRSAESRVRGVNLSRRRDGGARDQRKVSPGSASREQGAEPARADRQRPGAGKPWCPALSRVRSAC